MTAAEIFDRGYRKFDGDRGGSLSAIRSVNWYTTKSILGLGRKARHKVFPVIVALVAFLPAIIFLGMAILIGDLLEGELRPEYWELFGFSFMAFLVFTTMVAPEAIVRDRRDGMLPLYLSTPLTKVTYLLSKAAAVVSTMMIIVLGPSLLALVGFTVQGMGPDGFGTWIETLAKLVLAALTIVIVLGSVALGAASLTDRRAFASVAVVMVLLGLAFFVDVMVSGVEAPDTLRLLDPLNLPFEVAPRLFSDRTPPYQDVSTSLVLLGNLGWVVGGVGTLAASYRKLGAV